MSDQVTSYNYDAFIPKNFEPWMRFNEPPLGYTAPDFPLWTLDRQETSLLKTIRQHAFTIIEFGSFT